MHAHPLLRVNEQTSAPWQGYRSICTSRSSITQALPKKRFPLSGGERLIPCSRWLFPYHSCGKLLPRADAKFASRAPGCQGACRRLREGRLGSSVLRRIPPSDGLKAPAYFLASPLIAIRPSSDSTPELNWFRYVPAVQILWRVWPLQFEFVDGQLHFRADDALPLKAKNNVLSLRY